MTTQSNNDARVAALIEQLEAALARVTTSELAIVAINTQVTAIDGRVSNLEAP